MIDELNAFQQCFSQNDMPKFHNGEVFRLVETQEFAATTTLVDDLDEQFLLEQMLDEVKPLYRPGSENMHYLLKTPFRYPPLQYGSRFGSRLMASFFYAGEQPETILAEVAYYRFVFLSDMAVPYEKAIQSEHLMFSVRIKTNKCADLSDSAFAAFKDTLRHTQSYSFCQSVGQWLAEEQGVEMIRYYSARHPEGTNVAIYDPYVIQSDEPENQQRWLCHTKADKISFTQHGRNKPMSFDLDTFLVNGKFPRPA